jgi:hypothetical protein
MTSQYQSANLRCALIFKARGFKMRVNIQLFIAFQITISPRTGPALQYNTIQYNTIQYNTIQYNTIQYNTIQYNTIQYNTIQYNTIQKTDARADKGKTNCLPRSHLAKFRNLDFGIAFQYRTQLRLRGLLDNKNYVGHNTKPTQNQTIREHP